MIRLSLVAFALCLGPAQAQEPRIDAAAIESCLADGGNDTCIGIAIEPCMESLGGFSTPAHQGCSFAELEWWDGYLNRVYVEAVARSRTVDARSPDYGMPNRPSDVDALRAMQRAWIGYRDATCNYEELQWWGGTGASGARLECLLRLTGTQAMYLRDLLSEQ